MISLTAEQYDAICVPLHRSRLLRAKPSSRR